MAILKSKQISTNLSGSYVITGSLETTGNIRVKAKEMLWRAREKYRREQLELVKFSILLESFEGRVEQRREVPEAAAANKSVTTPSLQPNPSGGSTVPRSTRARAEAKVDDMSPRRLSFE